MTHFDKVNGLVGTIVPVAAAIAKLTDIVAGYSAIITFAIGALVGITSLIINLLRIPKAYRDYRDRHRHGATP